MQLHQIQVIGVVCHPLLGIMLTQRQIAEGSWSFWGTTLSAGEDWRNALFLQIKQKTWIEDLSFGRLLWAQSFLPGVMTQKAVFGLFVQVHTQQAGHGRGYRWIKDLNELDSLALFHPLVKNLCADALKNKDTLLQQR